MKALELGHISDCTVHTNLINQHQPLPHGQQEAQHWCQLSCSYFKVECFVMTLFSCCLCFNNNNKYKSHYCLFLVLQKWRSNFTIFSCLHFKITQPTCLHYCMDHFTSWNSWFKNTWQNLGLLALFTTHCIVSIFENSPSRSDCSIFWSRWTEVTLTMGCKLSTL